MAVCIDFAGITVYVEETAKRFYANMVADKERYL